MKEQDANYESQYLALCQRFEELRRLGQDYPSCPQCRPYNTRQRCPACGSRGWFPRPEPERLGALVDLCHQQGHDVVLSPGFATVIDHEGDQDGEGPDPWQALTAALRAALPGLRSGEATPL